MKKQKIKTRAEFAVTAAAVIAVAALANYLSNSFFFRIDLTENKQYTVSDATKRVLRGLDDIVTVKAFFSKDLPPETHNTVNTARDLLNEYKNIAGGKLRVSWIDPAGNEEEANSARSLNVPEITLQTIKQDKAQAMKGYMGIGIMYADRKESIPVVQNLANLEYDLTQAIMKVKRASAPKIGILKSQAADFIPPEIGARMNMGEETTDKKFAPLFRNLEQDYDVVTVDVSEGAPIDKDIRTLIIPGGDRFGDRAVFEIDQFFMNGGNLLVLANATTVSFQYGPQGYVRETKLLELLEHYGVRVERNMIMDASCGHVQVPRNVGPFTINELVPYPYFVRIVADGFAQNNPVVSAQSELMLGWASSLTHVNDTAAGAADVAAAPLAFSSAQSWEVTGHFDLNPQAEYQIPAKELLKPHLMATHLSGGFKSFFDGKPVPPVREKNPDDEDDKMSQINLTGDDKDRAITPSNANANLVVIGDANFISAQNANRPNIIFMLNLTDWLSLDNNLIAIRSRALKDKTINPNVLEEGSSTPGMIRWINLLLMPIAVAAAGIIISLKRREKAAPVAATAATTSNNTTEGKPDEEK
jgi:gliding-associated putative ABC transporter substrate-binding component GldG